MQITLYVSRTDVINYTLGKEVVGFGTATTARPFHVVVTTDNIIRRSRTEKTGLIIAKEKA